MVHLIGCIINTNIHLLFFFFFIEEIYTQFRPYLFFPTFHNLVQHRNYKDLVLKRFNNIVKSDKDIRLYRGLELSNQMRVLLISDPKTMKSAAALKINVGSMNDPEDVDGLAHFCEHMLFMGTKKYPVENEYFQFVQNHGGASNAGTGVDETFYHFDISPESLAPALDRFSQFFISPLFTEGSTEREISSVNAEFQNNLASDTRRLDQLNRHLAKPNHPYHRFSTGNFKTLYEIPKVKNINLREKLIDFHDKWYSSNIMDLAILGKESLDELENMVVPLFSKVINKNAKLPVWNNAPFSDAHFRTKIYVAPIQDMRDLIISFPVKDLSKYYKSSPEKYINTLLNYQGPGSIFSVLSARGWITSINAESFFSPRGCGFFSINLELTEIGLDKVDDIVKVLFQFINMLRTEGPQKWIHDEYKKLSQMDFRFKDVEPPGDFVTELARTLRVYPMKDILSGKYMLEEWRPDLIVKIFKSLVPEKVRMYIFAKKFENVVDQVEPIYGTKYKLFRIPNATITEWKKREVNKDLKMPKKNEFIPSNFSLYPIDEKVTKFPVVIKHSPLTKAWLKQQNENMLPKANLKCNFISPVIYMDPANYNLAYMFTLILKDSLKTYTYSAKLAGLNWDFTINLDGRLILSMDGFNEKQHTLLKIIMKKMVTFHHDNERFHIIRENLLQDLKNYAALEPFLLIAKDEYFREVLSERFWSKQELRNATDQITISRLKMVVPRILSKLHIQCLVHGNYNQKKALQLVNIIETSLRKARKIFPLLPKQTLLNREIKLKDRSDYSFEVINDVQKASCIGMYFQCGMQTTENSVKVRFIAQILKEPTFNILRTKEQLGYVVLSLMRITNGAVGLEIIVQSDRHPDYLESRIEAFIDTMSHRIANMTLGDFMKHRAVVGAEINKDTQSLKTLFDKYWLEIAVQQYNFNRDKDEINYLNKLTKRDVENYFKVSIHCAFIELKKGYDRVVRSELWSTLSMYGMSGSLIRVLESLYEDSAACVRINGAYTDWFNIEKGVRQEYVASPWLFNLYIEDCLKDLKESAYELKMNDLIVNRDKLTFTENISQVLQKVVYILTNSLKL